MELQDTFWGVKYAKLQDAFGVIWDLNQEKLKSQKIGKNYSTFRITFPY
jgi:hypothetical protein